MNAELSAGQAVRKYRSDNGLSLVDLAEQLQREGCARPSEAKLSRIETGKQPVSKDLVRPLSKITGIPAKDMRPDLAELFEAVQ